MNIDTMYGGGATLTLLRALHVPDHPAPLMTFTDDSPPRVNVSWLAAHMTTRLSPRVVHFEELCSAAGRDRPTGLYTSLCRQLAPALQSLGVRAVTCEPATEFAEDKLARRGAWTPVNGWWIWWLDTPTVEVAAEAYNLVRTVQAERAA